MRIKCLAQGNNILLSGFEPSTSVSKTDILANRPICSIASDGAATMTGKVKGFISGMKSVARHIFHIHCIIHRQHIVAKNIGGDMEEALNAAIHVAHFVKSN